MAWFCFFNGIDAKYTIKFFPETESVTDLQMTDQPDTLAQADVVQMEQRNAD